MSTIKLHIARGIAVDGQTMVDYEVPYTEGMSLLDAIFWIRENIDSSLVVRYSCRSANACKECAAKIDGKARYLCSTRVAENDTFQIEPLQARGLIRDLVTSLD